MPQIIADFKAGIDRKIICTKYGLAAKTLSTHLAKQGLVRERGFLAKNSAEIVELYEKGESMYRIADLYATDASAIWHVLKKAGVAGRSQTITSRRYICNEHFFDVIDTEEKAYLLGMLYADGYNNEKRNAITLSLKESDVELMYRLNRLVFTEKLLYRHKLTSHPQFKFVIHSKHMSAQLARLGCWQAKGQTLQYPTWIDRELEHHFIRGCFDGDGSVFMNKANRQMGVNLVMSNDFCVALSRVIERELSFRCDIDLNTYEGVAKLRFKSNYKVRQFATYIYKGATLYLERKKERFDILFTESKSIKQDYMKKFKGGEHKPRKRGERHPHVKLTVDQIVEIKDLFGGTNTIRQIARLYNTSKSSIERIKSGRHWSSC